MADVNLERAKNLLRSAVHLCERGDVYGVAGLSYQAFESATVALMERVNGADGKTHFSRRERAKELLAKYRDKIDVLWEARNVDFYGNVELGGGRREISSEEVKRCLALVEKMVKEIEELIGQSGWER